MRFLVVCLLFAGNADACGWDPLGICGAAKEAVDEAIEQAVDLTDDVKHAAEAVVDNLFDRLDDTFEKVEAAVIRVEKTFKNDTEALIAYTSAEVKKLTDAVVHKLESLVNSTVSEVTNALDKIINEDIGGLVDNVFDRVSAVLHQFEQFAFKSLCIEASIIKQAELAMLADSMLTNKSDCECLASAASWYQDTCASQCTCAKSFPHLRCPCNIRSWMATNLDDRVFYAIRCKRMKEIEAGVAAGRSVSWISEQLATLQDLANQLHCYHFATPSLANVFARDALNITQMIYVWNHPGSRRTPASRKIQEQLQAHSVTPPHASSQVMEIILAQQKQLNALQEQIERLTAKNSPPKSPPKPRVVRTRGGCSQGSPYNCYLEALQKLEDAEQLVQQQHSYMEEALNKTRGAELHLDQARAIFQAANQTFALKSEVLFKKGDQSLDGSLKLNGALNANGNITTGNWHVGYGVDIDTLTGHAWHSPSGSGAKIRVLMEGTDGSLSEFVHTHAADGVTAYSCNCQQKDSSTALCQDNGKVSIGFPWICEGSSCQGNPWTPEMNKEADEGIMCCDICLGTKAQAKAALAAMPVRAQKSCKQAALQGKNEVLAEPIEQ